jgi:hypothetical protein
VRNELQASRHAASVLAAEHASSRATSLARKMGRVANKFDRSTEPKT